MTDSASNHAKTILPVAGACALAGAALLLSPVTWVGVVAAACGVATGEVLRLARRTGATPVPLAGFAAVAGSFALAYRGPDALLNGLPSVAGAAAALCLVVLVARSRIEGALIAAATTVGAALAVGAPGSFVVVLRQAPGGFRVSLAFVILVAANEIAARGVGVVAAGRSDDPSIVRPPAWAGIAAGSAATLIAAVVIGSAVGAPVTTSRALVLAAVVALVVPLGRACIAMIRTDDAVGGVLARIDGALFAAPVFYLTYRAMVR